MYLFYFFILFLLRIEPTTLINKNISSIIIGSEDDCNIFFKASEAMKDDESSYRVRFLTYKTQSHLTPTSEATKDNSDGPNSSFYNSVTNSPKEINSAENEPKEEKCEVFQDKTQSSTPKTSRSPSFDFKTPRFESNGEITQYQEENFNNTTTDSFRLSSYNINQDDENLDEFIEIEGQGVLIFNKSSGEPSHVCKKKKKRKQKIDFLLLITNI